METRISVTVTKSGKESFIIEKKSLNFEWYFYLLPIVGWIQYFDDKYSWQDIHGFHSMDVNRFDTLDEAKFAIDDYIKSIETKKLAKDSKKIIKKYFIKYP